MNVASAAAPAGVMSVARDYLSLLKLRIVLLLDATAIGVMIPAAHGHPRLEAVIAVLVGGTLSAGGAHAINCWFDALSSTSRMFASIRTPDAAGEAAAGAAEASAAALAGAVPAGSVAVVGVAEDSGTSVPVMVRFRSISGFVAFGEPV